MQGDPPHSLSGGAADGRGRDHDGGKDAGPPCHSYRRTRLWPRRKGQSGTPVRLLSEFTAARCQLWSQNDHVSCDFDGCLRIPAGRGGGGLIVFGGSFSREGFGTRRGQNQFLSRFRRGRFSSPSGVFKDPLHWMIDLEKNQKSSVTRVGFGGVFYSLAHVPDLVRYGSKPSRVIRSQPAFAEALGRKLRNFPAAVAYAPHQVYVGNATPQDLKQLEKPWFARPIESATARGMFGDIVDEESFYLELGRADQFELVTLDEGWTEQHEPKEVSARPLRARPQGEIRSLCDKRALALDSNGKLIGAFDAGHPEDPNLAADVLLENLAAKATAAHSLKSLLESLHMQPEEIDFVISCSEEAIGDRYNRGGGNLAKAIAEEVGCGNASGSDVKAFCAGRSEEQTS